MSQATNSLDQEVLLVKITRAVKRLRKCMNHKDQKCNQQNCKCSSPTCQLREEDLVPTTCPHQTLSVRNEPFARKKAKREGITWKSK